MFLTSEISLETQSAANVNKNFDHLNIMLHKHLHGSEFDDGWMDRWLDRCVDG